MVAPAHHRCSLNILHVCRDLEVLYATFQLRQLFELIAFNLQHYFTTGVSYNLLEMAANQNQVTPKIIKEVNRFRLYRDPNAQPLTEKEIQDYYRLHDYVEVNPSGPAPYWPGWPKPGPPLLPQTPSQNKPFLDKTIPELADWPNLTDGKNWRGVKYLGEGGNAQAGLWSYTGPIVDGQPVARDVVVKELFANKSKDVGLRYEGWHMNEISQNGAQHVVKLLRDPFKTTGAVEGLGPEWDGKVRRLILEYCSLGDLFDLNYRHIRR